MDKLKGNQKGFSVIGVILILIIIGMVGFIGWYVYNAKKSTDATLNNASSTNTSTKTTQTISSNQTTNYLIIKEWQVKLKVPNNLLNMSYEIHDNRAYLGSSQLQALVPACSVQSMALGNLQRSLDKSVFASSQKPIKIGDYYYYAYNNPQASCTDSSHPEAAKMQLTAENQLRGSAITKTIADN